MIKKYFSVKGMFVIGVLLSLFSLPFTLGTIVRLIVPASAGLAAFPLSIMYAIPLLFIIIPLLPFLLAKSYQGSKKYQIFLFIYILFLIVLNLYELYKTHTLFKIPFLRVNVAPLTSFELKELESHIGTKIYTPNVSIKNIVPDSYEASYNSSIGCPTVIFYYRKPYGSLTIEQMAVSCQKPMQNNQDISDTSYKEIYHSDSIQVIYDNSTTIASHTIIIGTTLIRVNPSPPNDFSMENLIDLATSLK